MIKKIVGKVNRATASVIYGVEGIGKSTLAAQTSDPLFIDLEGGTYQLDVARVEPPGEWEELISMTREVSVTPGICKTLVLDTADRAEMLAMEFVCRKYKQTSIEGFGYGKGYVYLQEEYKRLQDVLSQVVSAGINVMVLAHARMRKQELPDEAGAFDRWELKLTRQVAPMVKEWCDALLFANYKTYVVTTDNDTKKATGGKRVLYTTHHPCWDAKNRIGLPDEISMEYASIAPLFYGTEGMHQPEGSPYQQLRELMDQNGVTDADIQKVVSDKGHYPLDTPISEYPDKFISGWLIVHWQKILLMVQKDDCTDK